MSLLTFIKGMFSTPKVIDIADNIIDGTIRGIDALAYTDEEKAQMSLEGYKLWLKTQEVLVNENTAKSITRRILAIMAVGNFLLLLNVSVVYVCFNKLGLAKQILAAASVLDSAVVAIIFFYFGYYGVSNVIQQAKKKNGS